MVLRGSEITRWAKWRPNSRNCMAGLHRKSKNSRDVVA
jgi:hypothetical protein